MWEELYAPRNVQARSSGGEKRKRKKPQTNGWKVFAEPERRSEETEGGDGRWRRRVEQLMYVGRLERALQLYIYIHTRQEDRVCVCACARVPERVTRGCPGSQEHGDPPGSGAVTRA